MQDNSHEDCSGLSCSKQPFSIFFASTERNEGRTVRGLSFFCTVGKTHLRQRTTNGVQAQISLSAQLDYLLPEGLRFAHDTLGRLVADRIGFRGGDIILQHVGILILKGIRILLFPVTISLGCKAKA